MKKSFLNMKNNLQKEIEKYFGYMLPSESSRYYSSAEILAMKDSLEYDDFLDFEEIQSNLDGDFTSLSDDEKEEAYEEAIEEIQKSYEKWISEQRISCNT